MDLQMTSNPHALAVNEDKKRASKKRTPYKGKREKKSKFWCDKTTYKELNADEDMNLCPYYRKGPHKQQITSITKNWQGMKIKYSSKDFARKRTCTCGNFNFKISYLDPRIWSIKWHGNLWGNFTSMQPSFIQELFMRYPTPIEVCGKGDILQKDGQFQDIFCAP